MASTITAGTTSGTALNFSADTSGNLTVQGVPIGSTTGIGQGNASIMKNRIINGAMTISQYNGTSSVTPANNAYVIDRFAVYMTTASKFTTQQSTTAPTGFNNSLLVTSSSAFSVGTGDIFGVYQRIEGYNVADLGWGTANAKTVTVSFQVYSSLTGTFGGALLNGAGNRSYPFSYSIPVANTWTTISVTIAGDTAGTWLTTNGIGLSVVFGLGVGSTYSGTAGAWAAGTFFAPSGATSVVGTSGATFYITGVQLEVGSSATGFEYRQYQQELALCQRYYSVINDVFIRGYGYSAIGITLTLPTTMRSTPTVTKVGTWTVLNALQPTAGTDLSTTNTASIQMQLVPSVPGDCYTYTTTSGNYVSASSEL